MRIKYCVFFLALILLKSNTCGQNLSPLDQHYIDSLKLEFRNAKHDSTRLKIKTLIGHKTLVQRVFYWDSIIVEAQKLQLPTIECQALIRKAEITAHFLLRHDEAKKYANNALDIVNRKKLKYHLKMNCLYTLTEIGLSSYNIKEALAACYEGLKIAEFYNEKGSIANFNSGIGRAYFSSENAEKCLPFFKKALGLYKEMGRNHNTAYILNLLGNYYESIGDTKNQIKSYMDILNYVEFLVPSVGKCEFYQAIASGYLMKDNLDSANFFFTKSYDLFKKLNSLRGITSSLFFVAQMNFKQGKTSLAIKQGERSLKLADSIGFKAFIPTVLKGLKEFYTQAKDFKNALRVYEQDVKISDSLAAANTLNESLEKDFTYNLEKKENQNKLLAQQNEIQSLQLSKNKYLLYGFATIVIVVICFAFILVRQNRLKALQQTSQLEQKLLRSQMNPHFIFNSLQAIQNYILKKNEKEAVKYLSSFANVTRNVLENSRLETIPLKKEIALLENYLQLQKLRFGNRFEYFIKVDERINAEEMNIPPMLAQPFIENAVEHGMHNIENDGKIEVTYSLQGESLIMEITDNGYGMGQAGQPGKQHQSLALEITKERVALLNKKEKQKTGFKIMDAFPEMFDRKGVKVQFSIPLILTT